MINGKPKYKSIYLHKFISEAKGLKHVDHLNHNTLDNRKLNLGKYSTRHNTLNRKGANKNCKSGHRNVHWDSQNNCWMIQFWNGKTCIIIGRYKNLEDAVKVVEKERDKFYSKFMYK